MSKVLKPITVPSSVTLTTNNQELTFKGSKGVVTYAIHQDVTINHDGNTLSFSPKGSTKSAYALVGTMRALVLNIIKGVSESFEKKLELVGVGYRAQAAGSVVNLTLGFSHPVEFAVPDGITIETPTQTEVIVRGIDKQQVGQVAANIRAYRPPEPYKGKGIRYSGEIILRKEAKKK